MTSRTAFGGITETVADGSADALADALGGTIEDAVVTVPPPLQAVSPTAARRTRPKHLFRGDLAMVTILL
ncbi:hypothetical protein GCM10012278_38730 [Nonomuraea glycinis]|uniref:Uncharacterized protein n=1 Tax=Nonomuraea glycinis TaxID=2047744 RepID=A0A918E6D0_9ACTN|nr:hypothetical protein GCM10012278_38730 [Nonomuraea glycinis]